MSNSISFSKSYSARNDIKFGIEQLIKVNIQATLRKPIPDFRFGHLTTVNIQATLNKPIPTFSVSYDNNVWRGVDVSTSSLFSETAPQKISSESSWGTTTKCDVVKETSFDAGVSCYSATNLSMRFGLPVDTYTETNFDSGLMMNKEFLSQWKEMSRADNEVLSQWTEEASAKDKEFSTTWHEMLWADRQYASEWKEAKSLLKDYTSRFGDGNQINKGYDTLYRRNARIRPGFSWRRVETEPPQPPPIVIDNSIVFLKQWARNNKIVFGLFVKSKYIVSKRAYYMLNQIDVVRISDSKRIQVSNVNCSTSVDDWGWRISANVVGKASYDLLRETPYTEILITINGESWRCFVVDLKESRTFGKGNYSLTAIGRSLELEEPFSMLRSKSFAADRQVVQLADEELTDTGWAVIWSGNDWLVSGGSYAYANLTPIRVISDVAGLSGNFVYSHRNSKTIQVKKRFPALPWALSAETPDFVLPLNPIRELSREFVSKPNYNGVYVAGGLLAKVRRDGSDGLTFPDNILTNQLITNDTAARVVGSEFLADNLSHHRYQYSTMLSNDVPLVDVGSIVQLIGTDGYKGISQSVSIAASLNQKAVKVVQSFEIHRWS